ncbi:MAG: thiol-disulfide oxidoreductase DCC family protein [Pyrinomonadaceae bacterium]
MERIVLFDGVCNYCNAMVNFTIRHDPEKKYKFATLQSDIGKKLLDEHAISKDIDSVILLEDGRAFTHSTAGLRIARNLGGIYSLSYAFIIIPAFIRDWAYKLFAKYRYRLFGRTDACMIPTQDVKERFI